MKIFLILDETNFYHPQFTHSLIEKLKLRNYEVEVGLVTKIKDKNSKITRKKLKEKNS